MFRVWRYFPKVAKGCQHFFEQNNDGICLLRTPLKDPAEERHP